MGNSSQSDLPRFLQARLDARGLTQAQAAREADINPTQLSRWITGKAVPEIEYLRKLAPVLKVELVELVVRAGHLTSEEAGLKTLPERDPHTVIEDLANDRYAHNPLLRDLLISAARLAKAADDAGNPLTVGQAEEADRRGRSRAKAKTVRQNSTQ